LQDLEGSGAFVVSLDPGRSWFRYHQMFADLLQLELRRTEPTESPALHSAAAGWYAEHGYPVEAVRHAQASHDWSLAAHLLSDHWVDLGLNGQAATAGKLLTRFPAGIVRADAELTALLAAGELTRGSLAEAERQLVLATHRSESVPADRRDRFQVMLTVLRLCLARQRGDLPGVAEEAEWLFTAVEAPDAGRLGLGAELRALVLICVGMAEVWSFRYKDANRHLEQGVTLAQQIGRPYLEITGLAHAAELAALRACTLGAQLSRQAIELARRHGWSEEPIAAAAYVVLGGTLVAQGRLEEGEQWLERAGRTLQPEVEPAIGMHLHYARGGLAMARGHHVDALAAFRAAGRLAETLVTPHVLATPLRAHILQALVGLGETGRVEQALAGLDSAEREGAEMRVTLAALRLATRDPRAAKDALAPIRDGALPRAHSVWVVAAFLLTAIACDALGDPGAAGRALERALDLAEPDRILFPFLVHPAPELLERHARRRTAHAALVTEILGRLAGKKPASPPGERKQLVEQKQLVEPLSGSETRILRYLPTNMSAPEMAAELSLSVNTVRTHIRHLYEKLGAHRRAEAVERSRALGLLAGSSRR
jgi:LuxR family maltose regulon positive regulatory protein